MGKPLVESRAEIAYAAEFFRWFSEEAVRIAGSWAVAPNGSTRLLTMKQPVGPCLLITPWNFPMAMGTRKIGSAVAAGCTMVVKPAAQTARVTGGEASALPEGPPVALDGIAVAHPDGREETAEAVLGRTFTDGFLVLTRDEVVVETYPGGMAADRPHMLLSLSKSVVGCVVAALAEAGLVDVDGLLTLHLPELLASGYAGATVRHLLDMRSGISYSEDYLDPLAGIRVFAQVVGWASTARTDLPASMYEWLATLTAAGQHGGAFHYRSCETDVLGWLCERASGRPMHELISELLWRPIGAQVDMDAGVDRVGSVIHDGGLAATLRDVGRFGLMLLNRGRVGDTAVLPEWWIDDTMAAGQDSRAAFAQSEMYVWMPGGRYRNQFWLPYMDRHVVMGMGINGQLLVVDLDRGTVAVKLSSWPLPQDPTMPFDTLRMVDAVSAETSLGT
jgi:CubicO group peptidase (beta-lactamase class C family)